ncbi:MAG: transcription termination/antitermination protein NusG [Flavobacteriales bacterium]|nr:transcription termination/antitermination protein NusG [Flavobacteriales bacterium]MCX7649838.1 transcription termination/antitermination protein NusG [Flavobacteriales bacterium]MDW8432945.1 transcription termination/antitermination protein NusG [Flavobacteriales bacterium]
METATGKKWYVVRAISGQEKKVCEQIKLEVRRNHLEHLLGQVFVPMEKVIQLREGKKITKEKPIFPGYILVEADLTGELPHVIKNTPGVLNFLGAEKGGAPLPMRQQELNRIFGKVDEGLLGKEEMVIPFYVGETVKVIDGPFNNLTAVIEEINEEKKKLRVSVKIFGRKTPLELNYMQVAKEN